MMTEKEIKQRQGAVKIARGLYSAICMSIFGAYEMLPPDLYEKMLHLVKDDVNRLIEKQAATDIKKKTPGK